MHMASLGFRNPPDLTRDILQLGSEGLGAGPVWHLLMSQSAKVRSAENVGSLYWCYKIPTVLSVHMYWEVLQVLLSSMGRTPKLLYIGLQSELPSFYMAVTIFIYFKNLIVWLQKLDLGFYRYNCFKGTLNIFLKGKKGTVLNYEISVGSKTERLSLVNVSFTITKDYVVFSV